MRVGVLSDPHFAGSAEKARHGWERRAISRPWLRMLAGLYRRFLWLADPTAHNHQVDAFVAAIGKPDWVVANGDYSCDSAFVGVADDAALASAQECLHRLRSAFGSRFLATLGDHELGKLSLFGGVGGLRLESWRRCQAELGLSPLWSVEVGGYRLVGVTSSLAGLPAFIPEILPEERDRWEGLRADYMGEVEAAFDAIPTQQPILLFCHDPTALPYLAALKPVRERMRSVECTVIGHLHSELVFHMSRCLAGMPELSFMGNTARRLSGALRKARAWSGFRLVLCPSLAGVQLRKDGGYLELDWDDDGRPGLRIHRRYLPWS